VVPSEPLVADQATLGASAGWIQFFRILLRIEDAVQIKGRRCHCRLTQHHVDLPPMVRLVVEQVTAGDVRRFDIVFTLIVGVCERPAPKRRIEAREERLDAGILPHPGIP
jgi:hypothetical protein